MNFISNLNAFSWKPLQPTAGRSHDAVIRVYDEAGNVIEMDEHKGEFKEW
jgi:hypothetical protein